MSSTKFVFLGRFRKTRWPPWPLIGWDIFDFSYKTAEQNWMKLVWKQDLNVLHQICIFRADRKNKMAALASDWLRHFRLLLWNRWTEFNETWQGARFQRPLQNFVFFVSIGKTRWPLWPLIGWNIFDFSSETAKRNSTELDRKQDLNVFRCQSPLPILYFLGQSVNKTGGKLYSGARYVALWASCYCKRITLRFMEIDIYREWVNILKSWIMSYKEPCQ